MKYVHTLYDNIECLVFSDSIGLLDEDESEQYDTKAFAIDEEDDSENIASLVYEAQNEGIAVNVGLINVASESLKIFMQKRSYESYMKNVYTIDKNAMLFKKD